MFSPQHITRAAAVALVAGAIAAPAASAMPTHFRHPLGGPNHPVSVAANPLGSPTYSQQDKQLVPSSPTQAPVTARPTVVRVSNPISRFGPPPAFGFRGADNLGEAALGAGAVVFVILGIGGAPALLQRRTRKRAGVRTGKPAVATG